MAVTVASPSPVILVTALVSLLGLLLNLTVLYVILKRGTYRYQYLFAAIVAICAVWDLGVFLMMVRNSFENEHILYAYVVMPCMFLPVLIYQFTTEFVGRFKPWTSIFLWVYCTVITILLITGMAGKIVGVYNYSWGNIYRGDQRFALTMLTSGPVYYFATISSCWYLYYARRRTHSSLRHRHLTYILASFIALSIALLKVLVVVGIDMPFLLPAGMLLNDIFVALIGVAIIKYSLFDITVIVKKTAIISLLAALVILIFSVSEHLLTTYLVHMIGGHSTVTHILSLALVIALFTPIKQRVEHAVEAFFSRKKLELEF